MKTITTLEQNIDIAPRRFNIKVDNSNPIAPTKPSFSEVVDISETAVEKYNQSQAFDNNKVKDKIAEDIIRVTSTIGRSGSARNLTNNQATAIYQQIEKLL